MSTPPLQPDILNAIEPVERIATDVADDKPVPGRALCLSGGGFRAMLFHAGALWRLNEFGLLPQIDRISSVSGGSITAGVLGLAWNRLSFDSNSNVAQNFNALLVDPVRRFAGEKVDIPSILKGLFWFGSVSDYITKAYRKHLFGGATLQDLPDHPRFVINASNVQSKALWRFSKPYMWDYKVGEVEKPHVHLAAAVAASSAFPPFLSPLELKLKQGDFKPGTGQGLERPPFTTNVVLSDGGVYDNLGLETAWKRYQTVLVSDAGGMYQPEPQPKRDWFHHTRRVYDLIDNQVRSLRKRLLIDSYKHKVRSGAYWGIWTDIAEYELPDALLCPLDKTQAIASTSTRLTRLDSLTQERIINWGYAVCDAAMRTYGGAAPLPKSRFPYTGGVG
jgi:NTE family protein